MNACNIVGSEVLTTMVIMSSDFWDITPYNPFKVNEISEENVASIFGSKIELIAYNIACISGYFWTLCKLMEVSKFG
jgi:hypothetical protein